MSQQPNRNRVLFGFGAVVVILVAAFFLWPANFRKEDASGAIGAVQKHHAPQITQQDVILGGESVKHHQQILYSNFLADAAKLRSLAASRDMAGVRTFSRELNARYLSEFTEALAAARTAAQRSAQAARLDSEIAEMSARMQQRQVADAELQQFAARLSDIEQQLGVRAYARLASADEAISAAASRLQSAKLESEYMEAANKIAAARQTLDRDDVALADEVQALGDMQLEMRTLNSIGDDAQLAQRLNAEAEALCERALANMKADFEQQVEMAARLNDIDSQLSAASRSVASRAGMTGSRGEQQLANEIDAAQLAVRTANARFTANARAEIRGELGAMEEMLADRGDANLNSQILAHAAEMQSRLSNRSVPLASMLNDETLAMSARTLSSRSGGALNARSN